VVEWFCQDICGVVAGLDSGDSTFVFRYHVTDVMEFNPDVFDMRVEDMVFSELEVASLSQCRGVGPGSPKPNLSRSCYRKEAL